MVRFVRRVNVDSAWEWFSGWLAEGLGLPFGSYEFCAGRAAKCSDTTVDALYKCVNHPHIMRCRAYDERFGTKAGIPFHHKRVGGEVGADKS